MELYNAQTRKREDINDQDALHQALMNGTHSFKTGSQVPALSPSGEDGFVPAENVAEAIKAGYRIKTGIQNQAEAYADRPENSGIRGALKTFGMQAFDEGLLGIPEMVADSTQDPLEVAKRQEMKKRHDIANAAGGTLGFGGSLLYGGPLWKGASKAGAKVSSLVAEKIVAKSGGEVSKSMAKRIAKGILENTAPRVAGGAVEGVIASSPIALTEAALGDPDAAAESILAGIGIGGLFGGVLGVGGAMGKKFKGMVGETRAARELRQQYDDIVRNGAGKEKLDDFINQSYFDALDGKTPELRKVGALEDVYDESGNLISLARTKNTKAIGKTLREEGIFDGGIQQLDEVANRIGKRSDEVGTQIGEKIDDIQRQFPTAIVDGQKIADNLRAKVLSRLQKSSAFQSEAKRFAKEIDAFAEFNGKMTLQQANALKVDYQTKIKDFDFTDKSFKSLLNEIPKAINKEFRETIATHDKKMLEDLIGLQRTKGNLEAAGKIAQKRAMAHEANNSFGLTSYGVGGATAIAFDAGMLSIPLGIMAGMGREFTRKSGHQALAKMADKYGGLLFAENAMGEAARKIDRIPQILDRMAKGTKEVTERARAASVPAIIRLFKEDSPKHMQPAAAAPSNPMQMLPVPKLKPLKRLQDENGTLANNPQVLLDRLAELTEPFTNSGAPMTGAALSARMAQVVQYINQAMPKPPRPKSPFAPQVEWEPSDYEMAAFNQKLDVIMDPFVALDELEAGTLTRNHIDALKSIYPVIFTAMQKKVLETVTNGVEPVPYADRVKLSMLMQTPMDPTMEQKSIAGYQAAFNAQGEVEGGQSQTTPQGVQINLAQGAQTQAQRLLGG